MLICQCNGVSDRTIRRVIREGADTIDEVGRSCGAGTCCSGCHSSMKKLIRKEASQRDVASTPASSSPRSTA